MSFISKIFGSKSKMHTSLVINDEYLEAVQLKGGKNKPEVVGINRLELDEGVIKGGEIMRESAFQEALGKLFGGAEPNALEPESLCVNIPFDQIYSFVRSFSKHTADELMLSELKELLVNNAPFTIDELEIEDRKKSNENKVYYGITAYPKTWGRITREALGELGFKDVHFFAEPAVQVFLAENGAEGNFVLFSWLNGHPYLSVFYHSLLYDSYRLKDSEEAEMFLRELNKESTNFENEYKEKIDSIYFAGFPEAKRSELKGIFSSDDLSVTYLRESETSLSSVIPVDEYSSTLVGLALKAFEF